MATDPSGLTIIYVGYKPEEEKKVKAFIKRIDGTQRGHEILKKFDGPSGPQGPKDANGNPLFHDLTITNAKSPSGGTKANGDGLVNFDPEFSCQINIASSNPDRDHVGTALPIRILAHELGHADGIPDGDFAVQGDHRLNIERTENPIMKQLGMPLTRTTYWANIY